MLLYLLSKKIFQKIRPSPADGKADGGTWFGNFYLTDILWGEHTQLTFIRRMLSDAALGMQDIDSLQQVAYETGITPCLRVTLLIGLRQHVAIFVPCLGGELVFVFPHALTIPVIPDNIVPCIPYKTEHDLLSYPTSSAICLSD